MEHIDYKKRIGNNIEYFMATRGISRKQIADATNCSVQNVGKWIRGDGEPGVDYLVILSDLFGVDIDSIIRKDCRVVYQDQIGRMAKDCGNMIVELVVQAISGNEEFWNMILIKNPEIIDHIGEGLLKSSFSKKCEAEADAILSCLDDAPRSDEYDQDMYISNRLNECSHAISLYNMAFEMGSYDAVSKKLSVLEKEQVYLEKWIKYAVEEHPDNKQELLKHYQDKKVSLERDIVNTKELESNL